MQVLEVWDCLEWDGGDRHNHKCFMSTESAAKGWRLKNPHSHVTPRTFVVFDSVKDMESNTKKKLIESAKAKLTTAERHALRI